MDSKRMVSQAPTTVNITVGSVDNSSRIQEIATAVKNSLARDNRLNQLNVGV